jgi:tripartite-type tricarboxylate transporter receptor subunit TctC
VKKIILGALILGLCSTSFAQNWPSKPIRVLVGFAPGGTSDVSARVTGEIVSKELGQAVIIENRPGGAGSIAVEALVRGSHDGYTIVVGSDSSFYQPVLNPALSYRTEKDLRPITILTYQPIVIAVHPAPGWRSIADLLKAAKARPGEIAYALPSATGTQAVAAGIFFRMAGVKLIAIPYKGGGQAVVDLVSGHVPVAVLGSAPLVPQVKAGRVRLLAVTSKARSKALPDVPTLAELGYPDMDISQWFGAVAPAGVPDDVVTRLSSAFNKALSDPKISQRLFDSGLEVVGGTPADMARRMKIETVFWSKAAKEAGLGAP